MPIILNPNLMPAVPALPAFWPVGLGRAGSQIAMIRQEFVAKERWASPEQLNRALAVYQILPGPEAHELCVYFGMLNRGRWGKPVAG